ncbi:exopolysaccharide biosynthesis protein [Alicyclobacillus cellulosilyticus]|uniref:Exopolysaccharide biosynthesis protein n=1 Tax=Alicyclobacillus cellulosilyticus TaxID=1003997 RepID=A0A917NHJ7_9BACL|nr:phosphodiester glycosidase family protein [Alicyclobacillus cellulosilyticus]GGI98577.1 exopolysaccharide biosynthesis protein [Alicyclobacillus cellulosilyticus]
MRPAPKVVRALTGLAWAALFLVYVWVSSALFLFQGPFPNLREFVIDSLTTSRHGYLLRPLSLYTLSWAEIRRHDPNLMNFNAGISSAEQAARDFRSVSDPTIRLETVKEATFTADVMLVRDPKRVRVAVTKYLGRVGQTVSEMVAEYHAVAGVNGGAFRDVGWQGTGGIPLGITIMNGKVIQAVPNARQPVIALTRRGALIAGAYTLPQLERLGVTQAISFGPVLVQNGVGLIRGNGGWGYAPRTAIGQRADGTIIFIVTDGRFIHGPDNVGASLHDIMDLMLRYGAVVAANLDGGSSTTMVYRGRLVNQPTDILGERKVATAFIVMPETTRPGA